MAAARDPADGARRRGRGQGTVVRLLIRTLLWGTAALALLCVAAPYGIGWLLSGRFDQVVAQLSVPGYLQVVRRDFERGWFVSHAIVVLRPIGALCHSKPCPLFTLDSRVDQGPLVWGMRTGSPVPVLAMVRTHADLTSLWPGYGFSPTPAPLTVISHIGLDGRAQVHLSLPGITFDVAHQNRIAQVETATVSGELQANVLTRRIDGLNLDWPSFSLLRRSAGHLGWRNLHFQAGPAPGGALANRQFSADSITLDNGNGEATRLTGIQLTTRSASPDTSAVSLNIESLVLPDNTRGRFILSAREHGIRALAWAALPGRWRRLGGWSGGALNAPALYHDIVPRLLPPGSRVRVNRFDLVTRDGAIRARMQIRTPPDFKPPSSAAGLLSQLQAELQLSLPRSILRRLLRHTLGPAGRAQPEAAIDVRVHELVARDLIAPTDNGQRYRLRVVLDDGRVTINGRDRPQWRAVVNQVQAAAQGL